MDPADQWKVHVSPDWDVLGPFPIHAREQHFLSPSFPLNLSEPVDLTASWPSSLADGGSVQWTTAVAEESGRLQVSFPHTRWSALRASEGWAALQHHSVLKTTLTIQPPQIPSHSVPNLLLELKQGSFFTLLPHTNIKSDFIPEWYSGNIYAMSRAPPHVARLPVPPSADDPTTYSLYVSGDYEIRLFGDPMAYESETPVLDISISAQLEFPSASLVQEPLRNVVCDFVNGLGFGDALGVGMRSISGWWTVSSVVPSPELHSAGISLSLPKPVQFSPAQTRILPIGLTQSKPFYGEFISIDLAITDGDISTVMTVSLNVIHRASWTKEKSTVIKASYLYAGSMPAHFLVLPPEIPTPKGAHPRPPILALHGAGVDIIEQPFWSQAVPRQKRSWVIMPTGRTAWGLDWHGPSARDAWESVGALAAILGQKAEWTPWQLAEDTKVLVVGHSNGGQGTWYLASRFPDRVVAAVPAAGYIKAQSYVPLTQSRSAHFIDPALRAVLETSFTPDDNDLFLSNLVDTPILAIHGGDDDNVPTWHTREAVSILKAWRPDANVSYREDPVQPHWYSSIFRNEAVEAFLEANLDEALSPYLAREFTLTVAAPAESGSLHGWRIVNLAMPGRLGRLRVTHGGEQVVVKTTNVKAFTLDRAYTGLNVLVIDGDHMHVRSNAGDVLQFIKRFDGWQVGDDGQAVVVQPSGRLQTVLESSGALKLVVPDTSGRELAIAQRIAHDLDVYHNLDAEVIRDSDALKMLHGSGNIVVISRPEGRYVRQCLLDSKDATPFRIIDSPQGYALQFKGQKLISRSQGAIFLHPHPTSASSSMVFMIANDISGLERLARLFPIRTGISLPDWVIIGEAANTVGAAGIEGAGIWGERWSYNNAISWHD